MVGGGDVKTALWMSRTDQMTEDKWFNGFPGEWNMVVPTLFLLGTPPFFGLLFELLVGLTEGGGGRAAPGLRALPRRHARAGREPGGGSPARRAARPCPCASFCCWCCRTAICTSTAARAAVAPMVTSLMMGPNPPANAIPIMVLCWCLYPTRRETGLPFPEKNRLVLYCASRSPGGTAG